DMGVHGGYLVGLPEIELAAIALERDFDDGWHVAYGLFEILAHAQILVAPPPDELVRFVAPQLVQVPQEDVVDAGGHHLMIGVRSTARFGNDLVDHLELEQIRGGNPQRGRRLLAHFGTLAILPQNCRAAFDRDHGVDRILEHQDPIGDPQRERATRSALADDRGDDGDLEAAHLEEIPRDRLRLTALLRAEAGPRAWRVDEREDRDVKLLGELHQAQRLAVALGMWHPEVAPEILLGIPAALVD